MDDLVAFLRVLARLPTSSAAPMGAFICHLTAIRHPQLVRSLVLGEEPVPTLFTSVPPRPRELPRLIVRRPRTALAIIGFGAGTHPPAQKAFRRATTGGDAESGLRHARQGKASAASQGAQQQARENVNTLRTQVLGAGFPPLSEDNVLGVTAPTLLMTGERSPA